MNIITEGYLPTHSKIENIPIKLEGDPLTLDITVLSRIHLI